jgi:hypothetical protein
MQLDKANDFSLLKPVYALNFVNDIFEKDEEMENEYFHHYKIVNIKNSEKQIKGLEFIFLELPKFKPLDRAEKKLHNLWLKFLTDINEETKEVPKELLENELTCEAVEYMKRAAYTKEELEAYDKWKIDIMTERGAINDAKNEGLSEGRVEGEAIGLKKGESIVLEKVESIGLKIGEQERVKLKQKIEKLEKDKALAKDKALEIAKNAKGVLGLSVEQIQKLTGLTKEEIEKL